MKPYQETGAFLSRAAFSRTSIVGKRFFISHKRFGRKIRNAINAPSQIQTLRSLRVPDVSSRERKNARPKNRVECLFRIPTPAITPKSNHKRGEPPLAVRIAMATQPIQKSGSKEFMERKLSIVR